jgi:hypothetical protein
MLIPVLALLYILIIYLLLGTIAKNTEKKGT